MVEQITERFRHQTLDEASLCVQQQQNQVGPQTSQNHSQAVQCGLYRTSGRSDSWSPVVTHPTTLVRGRSLDEATLTTNVFSIRQSQTPPTRNLETPPSLPSPRPLDAPRVCPLCEREWALNYPPNKRHCRSLSIPNTGGARPLCHHHVAANLYRPVALRPGSASKGKNRNSPLNTRSYGNLNWPHHHHQGVTSPGVQRSSSEFSSPPDSPIPRPASVSSGYFDSSMSSLAGIPWLEQQFSPTIFQKSLSMEDTISSGQLPQFSFSPPRVGVRGHTPTSGGPQKILRCRSQPCVLTKSGVKRRREELMPRPTVDFLKMKETAYHHFRRPRAHSASCPKDIRSPRSMLLADDDRHVFGLKPILGSPLDSHHTSLSLHQGLAHQGLSHQGLGHQGQHHQGLVQHHQAPKLQHIAVSPSTSPTQEVDEEVEGINFSNKLSSADSGCSADGDDPPHLVEYPDISDYSPCTNQRPSTDTDSIFPLDELDLEQIEND